MTHCLNPSAGAPGAWQRVGGRFPLLKSKVTVGGMTFWLPELRDPQAYLAARLRHGKGTELPYWTKVWPASLLLAGLVAQLSLPPEGEVLELGAGMGLPGLVAAARGRRVILTDLDPDALEFARAAAELSGLGERVAVRSLDWRRPSPDLGPFATILGAEVLYRPAGFPALAALCDRLLAPEGTVLFCHQVEHLNPGFFARLGPGFVVRGQSRRMTGPEPGEFKLHAVRRRPAGPAE